jgi:hypothetical protein
VSHILNLSANWSDEELVLDFEEVLKDLVARNAFPLENERHHLVSLHAPLRETGSCRSQGSLAAYNLRGRAWRVRVGAAGFD